MGSQIGWNDLLAFKYAQCISNSEWSSIDFIKLCQRINLHLNYCWEVTRQKPRRPEPGRGPSLARVAAVVVAGTGLGAWLSSHLVAALDEYSLYSPDLEDED